MVVQKKAAIDVMKPCRLGRAPPLYAWKQSSSACPFTQPGHKESSAAGRASEHEKPFEHAGGGAAASAAVRPARSWCHQGPAACSACASLRARVVPRCPASAADSDASDPTLAMGRAQASPGRPSQCRRGFARAMPVRLLPSSALACLLDAHVCIPLVLTRVRALAPRTFLVWVVVLSAQTSGWSTTIPVCPAPA